MGAEVMVAGAEATAAATLVRASLSMMGFEATLGTGIPGGNSWMKNMT